MERDQLSLQQFKSALEAVEKTLRMRLTQKGMWGSCSIHEILGVLVEEYDELLENIRANRHDGIRRELLDIAVACVWDIASIDSEKLHW